MDSNPSALSSSEGRAAVESHSESETLNFFDFPNSRHPAQGLFRSALKFSFHGVDQREAAARRGMWKRRHHFRRVM